MFKKNYDKLEVLVYETRDKMGVGAGKHIEKILVDTIDKNGEARVIFASAPSQNEALEYLVNDSKVEWDKVVGFHMDEYIGLPENSPKSFSRFIENKFFEKHTFKKWYPMKTDGDIAKQTKEYLDLLHEKAIDLVILGVGENGHLAFIDPPVCDFNDPEDLKVVELDQVNRQQQVNDGVFATIDDVPTHALSMTIPFLLRSKHKVAIVPGPTKRDAIYNMLEKDVSTECPASVLKTVESYLYVDEDAYEYVKKNKK